VDSIKVADGAFAGGLNYYLGTSELDVIQLYPEYEIVVGKKQIRDDSRTASGKLVSQFWGNYDRFKIDLDHVSAADASIVNSWWETSTKLQLYTTSGSEIDVSSLMIINKSTPFAQYSYPYENYYGGTLEMEGY